MELSALTQAERRSLGRFDTPRPLAQALTDWAIRDGRDTVLEPSCGGGVIVKSVIARLAELGSRKPARQIWACDIDPRALAETRKNIAPNEPNLVLGDFLSFPASAFGNIKLTAIIGNPPYVRLHSMDADTRATARKVLPVPSLLDAKASLWAYFPIHSFKFLAKGGRMGWILPETILHSEYGKQILRWAAQNFHRCIAVSLRERCFLADGAKERVVVLLLAGAGGRADREIEMLEFASANECISALPGLAHPRSPHLPQLNGHAVPHLVSDFAAITAHAMEAAGDLKRFSDFADVKIGVVTGDNDFFLLTEEGRSSAGLNARHFRRVVGKFANLGDGFNFTEKEAQKSSDSKSARSWMLCPTPTSVDTRLTEYLGTYSRTAIAQNRTMARRMNWQVPQIGAVPDAFFQYMGKHGPRIVLNEAGHYCTNTIHRIFFNKHLSQAKRRAICLSLHSSYSQLSAEFEGRQYGSGVLKLEPSEVRRLLFPFNKTLVKALSGAWPKLTKDAVARKWEEVVPRIDAIIASHCASLAKTLPLEKVRSLLLKVRQRRNSSYLSTGT